MNEIKEMAIHNQIENLSHLYLLLASTLAPTIVAHRDAPSDVVPCQLPPAAKSAAEVALIDVCNRISELTKRPDNWSFDKSSEASYALAMDETAKQLQAAALTEMFSQLAAPQEAPKKPKKKGNQ